MMIDTVSFGIRFFLLLPVLLFAALNHVLNLKKQNRSRQFLMPVFSMIFCIVFTILTTAFTARIRSLARGIGGYLEGGSQTSSGAAQTAAGTAGNFIRTAGSAWLYYMVLGVLFIALYLIFKGAVIKLLKHIMRDANPFYRAGAGILYEKSENDGIWYLKDEFVQAKTYLHVLYLAVAAVSAVLPPVTWQMVLNGRLASPYFPLTALALTGEVCFVCGGLLKPKEEIDFEGERDSARSVVQYSQIRPVLRSLFGDKLTAENTISGGRRSEAPDNEEALLDLERSGDEKEEAYALFMRGQMRAGLALDQNYMLSGRALLDGKSVLFSNPFYSDLIPYIFYPMNRILLQHRKVLVILGRHGQEEKIRTWLEEGIGNVTGIDSLWKIGILNDRPQDLDIGILTRSGVNNLTVYEMNKSFFRECGFGILAEPSGLVTTAQIGLRSAAALVRNQTAKTTWCAFDRNCDGLVDTLSHLLMTEFTEVSAMKHTNGISSYMCWEGDGGHMQHRMLPNLTRYLGFGTELAFAGLRNQVSEVTWYGGDAFPVTDIRWIVRQYYFDLLRYADLPAEPGVIDEHFHVSPDMWSAERKTNSFLIVEDEDCNMFEVKRDFSTRASGQGFINVISPAYLLGDYMSENDTIFNADPKAVPEIVADYARTKRNAVLRLCLLMTSGMVPEAEVRNELMLAGEEVEAADSGQLIRTFWYQVCLCFQPIIAGEGESPWTVRMDETGQYFFERTAGGRRELFSSSIVEKKRRFNMRTGSTENLFFIRDSRFRKLLSADLRNASYIAEDERGGSNYLGAELIGHIYQKYLPGQFFTFCGKYYEMERVTPDGQVMVRRSADHITGRPSYRQVRRYTLEHIRPGRLMGSRLNIGGMTVELLYADIHAATPAYWSMQIYNRFDTARKVEVNGIPERTYYNKSLLRIGLPDTKDGKQPAPAQCHTLAVLFNELFRTLFSKDRDYIAAVCAAGGIIPVPETYTVKAGSDAELDPHSIYIIEDSQLDIGLLTAVRRNLNRIFRIACDYLDWNRSAVDRSLHLPKEKPAPEYQLPLEEQKKEEEAYEQERKAGERIKKRFGNLFGRRKERENPEEAQEEQASVPRRDFEKTADPVSAKRKEMEQGFYLRRPYHERYYLLYGERKVPEGLDPDGTLSYLEAIGFGNGELKEARTQKSISGLISHTFRPGLAGHRYCDFCGRELMGTEYEILSDGRERCLRCSRSAVRTEEEFRGIFETVRKNMWLFFGIRMDAPIHVKMVNARRLHQRLGMPFVPTGNQDGRVLGVAIREKDEFKLMIENGSPRLQAAMTICHELTHIWQYTHWNEKHIRTLYGRNRNLEIYEGMAKWTEIQYAYLTGEEEAAVREELITESRNDEYGRGLKMYVSKYPFVKSGDLVYGTPFEDPDMPL